MFVCTIRLFSASSECCAVVGWWFARPQESQFIISLRANYVCWSTGKIWIYISFTKSGIHPMKKNRLRIKKEWRIRDDPEKTVVYTRVCARACVKRKKGGDFLFCSGCMKSKHEDDVASGIWCKMRKMAGCDTSCASSLLSSQASTPSCLTDLTFSISTILRL